jgi:hypothetical protein
MESDGECRVEGDTNLVVERGDPWLNVALNVELGACISLSCNT